MGDYTWHTRTERFKRLYDSFKSQLRKGEFDESFHKLDSKLNELLYSERIEQIFTEGQLLKFRQEYERMQGEIGEKNNGNSDVHQKY